MGETSEPEYRVTYLTGTKRIDPVVYRFTWLTHDEAKVETPYSTMTGGGGSEMLQGLLAARCKVEFQNERPPPSLSFIGRLLRRLAL